MDKIYNIDDINTNSNVFVVGSEADAMLINQCNLENIVAVALVGVTCRSNPEDITKLRLCKKVVFLLPNGKEWSEKTKQWLAALRRGLSKEESNRFCSYRIPHNYKDVGEYAKDKGQDNLSEWVDLMINLAF